VEINTNAYATARTEADRSKALRAVEEAARLGAKLGLGVLAGHALNYRNVKPIAEIELIEELNIGHAIVARAVFVGLQAAVAEMKALLQ
jgi:pyridoxine 5-phosphate synthase